MDMLGRLLLRFVVVPFGTIVAAAVAGAVVVMGHWNAIFYPGGHPDPAIQLVGVALVFVTAMYYLLLFFLGTFCFVLPAIGVLISEAFAVRSWVFHAANGLTVCLPWAVARSMPHEYPVPGDPIIVAGAGAAAGLAYWIVAGWTAGFWKPIGESPFGGRQPVQ